MPRVRSPSPGKIFPLGAIQAAWSPGSGKSSNVISHSFGGEVGEAVFAFLPDPVSPTNPDSKKDTGIDWSHLDPLCTSFFFSLVSHNQQGN